MLLYINAFEAEKKRNVINISTLLMLYCYIFILQSIDFVLRIIRIVQLDVVHYIRVYG